MATFDYSRPLATANRLIARFGQKGSVRRPGVSSGTAYSPHFAAPVSEPADFVIQGYSSKEIDGTRIRAMDMKALVAPGTLSRDPTPEDKLV
jgi:hypothetical protein